MKKPVGITIFGIINIVFGIIPTTFLIFESIRSSFFIIFIFLFTFAGWVTDNEFNGFFDWFLQTIIWRGSLIILYIFSTLLFWSGLTVIRKKPYGRKFSVISIVGFSSAWVVFFTSGILRPYLYSNDKNFDVNAIRISLYLLFGLLIYTFLFIRYLKLPKIKEYFDDANKKLSLKLIYLVVAIILIVIFMPALQYIHLFFRY